MPKCCDYSNKDDVNNPNILSNINYQVSFQKKNPKILINFLLCKQTYENKNGIAFNLIFSFTVIAHLWGHDFWDSNEQWGLKTKNKHRMLTAAIEIKTCMNYDTK